MAKASSPAAALPKQLRQWNSDKALLEQCADETVKSMARKGIFSAIPRVRHTNPEGCSIDVAESETETVDEEETLSIRTHNRGDAAAKRKR